MGKKIEKEQITLKPGDRGFVGGFPFQVVAIVKPKLTVRNAFGNLNHKTVELTIIPEPLGRQKAKISQVQVSSILDAELSKNVRDFSVDKSFEISSTNNLLVLQSNTEKADSNSVMRYEE